MVLSSANMPWREWCAKFFPSATSYPFAPRHVRLWEWFEALERGVAPPPEIFCVPRAGAKSATAELGITRLCVKLTRRLVLYVSATQDQAEKHVQSIASLMEIIGVDRKMNSFGVAKGWRRAELQTANGFNVVAFGLDTAPRGIKLEQFRPDLIVLDDIDVEHDTARTIEKKIDLITKSLLPCGAGDCAVLFLQNKIHEDGIMSQVCDGRADFLHDRNPALIEPAIWDMEYQIETRDNGQKRYRITAGTPSWEGQNIAACEAWIARIGITAFRKEMQHDVSGVDGIFFAVSKINYCEPDEVPPNLRLCRAWDLAGTQDAGDYTCGILGGLADNGAFYVLDMVHKQLSSDNVRKAMRDCAARDPVGTKLLFSRDPNQAGKDQADRMEQLFKAWRGTAVASPPNVGKAVNARDLQECVNIGNCYVVRSDTNIYFKKELQDFREDMSHLYDDIVDSASMCYNGLKQKRSRWGSAEDMVV